MDTQHSFRKFKKEPLIFSLIFFAIALAAFLFLYNQVLGNRESAENSELSFREEAARREEVRSIERFAEEIQADKVKLDSHFAVSSNVVPYLDTLESLGKQVSAKPEVVTVDVTKDKTSLILNMRAAGTFEAVYKFLLLLENSPYELEFTSVELRKTGEGAGSWEGNFKIKLLAFIP